MDEAVETRRRSVPIEPDVKAWLIREGRTTPLTKAQEAYVNARERLLGANAEGQITESAIRGLVSTGRAEVEEAIANAGLAGSMANRGNSHLGAIQEKLDDALAVLEGRRSSPFALKWVIDYATQEELHEVQAIQKERLRAAKIGVGIKPGGTFYIQTYPKTEKGQYARSRDIQTAEELPVRVQNRASQVRQFITDTYGPRSTSTPPLRE